MALQVDQQEEINLYNRVILAACTVFGEKQGGASQQTPVNRSDGNNLQHLQSTQQGRMLEKAKMWVKPDGPLSPVSTSGGRYAEDGRLIHTFPCKEGGYEKWTFLLVKPYQLFIAGVCFHVYGCLPWAKAGG
jgi:hypothetical protein